MAFDLSTFSSGAAGVLVGALATVALFGGRIAVHDRRFVELERIRLEDKQNLEKQRLEDLAAAQRQRSEDLRRLEDLGKTIAEGAKQNDRRQRFMLDLLVDLAKASGVTHRLADMITHDEGD